MKNTWYHGSHQVTKILEDGFDIEAKRASDAGDFGWGIYLTKKKSRAKLYGHILEITIDPSRYAYIPNPYFTQSLRELKPQTDVEKIFYDLAFACTDKGIVMLTLHDTASTSREKVAKNIRRVFLDLGYAGIITDHAGGEAVVFDVDSITAAHLLS